MPQHYIRLILSIIIQLKLKFMKVLRFIGMLLLICLSSTSIQAKKKELPFVKVYLVKESAVNGKTVIEGKLVKDWFTARQAYPTVENKLTVQTDGNEIKLSARDVDSIAILTNAGDYVKGEVYVCYASSQPKLWDKDKKVYKLVHIRKHGKCMSYCSIPSTKEKHTGTFGVSYTKYITLYLYWFNKTQVVFPYKAKQFINDMKEIIGEDNAVKMGNDLFGNKSKKEMKEYFKKTDLLFDDCDKWLYEHGIKRL